MKSLNDNIEILSAPSILGLKPTGVEELGESLLAAGLAAKLKCIHPVIHVPTLNSLYNDKRDPETNCLNPIPLRDFFLTLGKAISATINNSRFPFVLGGDCSILLGIFSALKVKANYGLIFLDAHADFYEPEKSITGEVADMDLAILTGRGPALLTNINHQRPYVKNENVIHIGQRDWEETRKYGSRDIRETTINCIPLADIESKGMHNTCTEVLQTMNQIDVEGFWIHFDTDVLSDEINPAVDYRLPGGLQFQQTEYLLRTLLLTGRITGISVTIFNPKLDPDKIISNNIAESLGRAFDLSGG
ncbi:MAG: arginase family protein [Ferruginibacter sp.]|nr:arginase family protein [Chitinophagaceae bacterium]